jgi:hypothetical protein
VAVLHFVYSKHRSANDVLSDLYWSSRVECLKREYPSRKENKTI